MRGPELVGNPPNNLRWSGDSQLLYFEWLMPKEDQPATWVVGRAGGAPRRLTDAERRLAPLANGQWDATRRRILGIDRGDIVIIDTVANTSARRDPDDRRPNRIRAGRAARRTSRSCATTTCSSCRCASVAAGTLVQLTDAAARRADPRPTDSQKFLKDEELKILDWVEQRRRAASAARRSIAPGRCRASSSPTARPLPMPPCRPTASTRTSSSTIAPRPAPRRCRALSASRRSPKRSTPAPRSAMRRIAGGWRCSISRAGKACGPASTAWPTPSPFPSRRGRRGQASRQARAGRPCPEQSRGEARRAVGLARAVARWQARHGFGARGRQHRALAGPGRSGDRHDQGARSPQRRGVDSRRRPRLAARQRAACGSSPSTTAGCISTRWTPRRPRRSASN